MTDMAPHPHDSGMPSTPPDPPTGTEAAPRAEPAPGARLWVVVLAACAGQFLVVLDVSVVNVALPSMRADLALSSAGLQWVVNAYTLTFAGFMLLGGRAADLFGRKRTFLVGLGLFTVASLAGGLAQEAWHVVAARSVQGVGAAVLAPATLTILTTSFPDGSARTRAIGTWTAVGAGGGAAGGLVGGTLTDLLSWRWVLLINVPVGALVLTAAAVWVTEARADTARRRLDVPGAVLVTCGVGAVAYGIVQTESQGWTAAAALLPLAAGLLLLGAFLVLEARTPAPLVPLKLFRLRSVSAANAAMFVCGAAMFAMWYFMSLYMQNVLHYSPIQAGLAFVPQSVSIVIGSKAAPRLMQSLGSRNLAVCGAALAGVGYLWQSTLHVHGGYPGTVLGPGVLMALGAGFLATPLATAATAGAAPGDAGVVSGLVNTSRTLGGALGLAVLSTVAASRTGGEESPERLVTGYSAAFLTAGIILFGCAILMLVALPRTQDDEPGERAAEAREERTAHAGDVERGRRDGQQRDGRRGGGRADGQRDESADAATP